MALSAISLFLGSGEPGIYWEEYAVARYMRAGRNSGSSSMAFWKYSAACGYFCSVKALTPLLSISRAWSLVIKPQPVIDKDTTSIMMNKTASLALEFIYFV